jgi:dihydrofolate synthase/folylpolyglutamate synthase
VRLAGLARARLAGRLETVATDPVVLVDGAHNGHAARALVSELPDAPIIAVIGVSEGKDIASIVEPIAARARAVVATQSRQDRAAAAQRVASAVGAGTRVEVVADVGAAIERARALADPGDVIVVAGSLFVAAEAREHALAVVPDPIPLADPPAIA